mmetsp:Transcript_33789/g.46313  ORF Transcript_33789/g.46313 Transcript_33789/m.46313 type:complete len:105 (-) Transcript_33789:2854-3168(-)
MHSSWSLQRQFYRLIRIHTFVFVRTTNQLLFFPLTAIFQKEIIVLGSELSSVTLPVVLGSKLELKHSESLWIAVKSNLENYLETQPTVRPAASNLLMRVPLDVV